MRRVPILATLVVAAAVATMIGLGIWQLERAEWKGELLAMLADAHDLPPLDLDRAVARGGEVVPLAFRRVRIICDARNVAPTVRAGRSLGDVPGQIYLLPCSPGASGLIGRLQVNAGWAPRHGAIERASLVGPVSGTLGTVSKEGPVILTADEPLPPLEPSRPPRVEDIPNNHLLYAFQWFFFAAAALLIFILALRRRWQQTLP